MSSECRYGTRVQTRCGTFLTWVWWWWNGYEDGAYWVIVAVFILATGETRPHYYKFLRPVWVPLRYIIDPIIFLITKLARVIIPEPYRRPQKVLKPLSFKEINEALDEAAENQEKKKNKRWSSRRSIFKKRKR